MKPTIPTMLFLGALAASCASRQYAGSFGLRKYFPDADCGETVEISDGVETEIYEKVDLWLFEDNGYCVPKKLIDDVAIRAAVLSGNYSIAYDGQFYCRAPGIAQNPWEWMRALQDADTNKDGNITEREAESLVDRTLKEVKEQREFIDSTLRKRWE